MSYIIRLNKFQTDELIRQNFIRNTVIQFIIGGKLDKISEILPEIDQTVFKRNEIQTRSILYHAIVNDRIEIFEYLKNNLTYRDEYLLIELLREAPPGSIHRKEQVIAALEYIKDINLRDAWGYTALYAIRPSYFESDR